VTTVQGNYAGGITQCNHTLCIELEYQSVFIIPSHTCRWKHIIQCNYKRKCVCMQIR